MTRNPDSDQIAYPALPDPLHTCDLVRLFTPTSVEIDVLNELFTAMITFYTNLLCTRIGRVSHPEKLRGQKQIFGRCQLSEPRRKGFALILNFQCIWQR